MDYDPIFYKYVFLFSIYVFIFFFILVHYFEINNRKWERGRGIESISKLKLKRRIEPSNLENNWQKTICHWWKGGMFFFEKRKRKKKIVHWWGNSVIEWLYQFNYSIIDRNWGIKIYTQKYQNLKCIISSRGSSCGPLQINLSIHSLIAHCNAHKIKVVIFEKRVKAS